MAVARRQAMGGRIMPVRELRPNEEIVSAPSASVRELRPDEEIVPKLSPVEEFGRGANVGLAETLGAPVDLANFALGFIGLDSEEPIGGSRQIRRGFAALGLAPPPGKDDPHSLFGSVGRVTGAATAFLLPVGAAGRAATKVATGTRAAPTGAAGRIVQDIGRTAVQTPGRFAAAEAAGAAGAGTGGFVARERFPDSESASFIGEILGGVTPAAALGVAKLLPTVLGIQLARRLARPFTTTGAKRRAERRVKESARDPDQAATELETSEALPEAGLTPAQQTGDEGLLSLERSVIDSSEQLKGQADEQIATATTAIRENLAGLGDDVSPEKTTAALEEARNYIRSLLDTRLRIAAQRADERIAALGPGATREEANIIARTELESALRAARQQERELWSAVPDTVKLKTANATRAFRETLKNTPLAQRDDIPSVAGRLLGRDEQVPEGFEEAFEAFGLSQKGSRLGEETTVAELQGLRSKLLEESRNARAAGKFNAARIADNLADAVLTDLGAQRGAVTGEAGAALRSALDFSADLNGKFTRGPVGRLLGSERRGGAKTPEEMTLETTVGRGGPRARVETQALLDAVEDGQRTPALRGAIEDFLTDDFQRRAVRDGKINKRPAATFLSRHRDVLDDFPELRSRIEGAIDADDAAAVTAGRAEGLAKRLNDPKVSRAAVFLKEPADQAMERIAKAGNPEETMREIVRQAGRDTTGDALKGVKTAFGDFLLRRASTGKATVEGDFIVSGRVLKRLLKDGPVARMAKALLSADEQTRLRQIADVAEKVEKAVAARARPEGVIADKPSMLFSVMARITGAQLGRQIAAKTGGGTVQTPGVLSNVFQRAIAARVQDPAKRLLMDAIGDKELFAALLRNGTTPADVKVIRRQLNAWLLAIGAEKVRDE